MLWVSLSNSRKGNERGREWKRGKRKESDGERERGRETGRSGFNPGPQLFRALVADRCPLQQTLSKTNTISIYTVERWQSHNTSGPMITLLWCKAKRILVEVFWKTTKLTKSHTRYSTCNLCPFPQFPSLYSHSWFPNLMKLEHHVSHVATFMRDRP